MFRRLRTAAESHSVASPEIAGRRLESEKRAGRRQPNQRRILWLVGSLLLLSWCNVPLLSFFDDTSVRSDAISSSHHDAVSRRPSNPDLITEIRNQTFSAAIGNVTVSSWTNARCRSNAIVVLAQKKHSTYDRDSYGLLIESLTLIGKNYIALKQHSENVDVFLFHTGDFDVQDIQVLEPLLGSQRRSILKLANLNDSFYWRLPKWHRNDNQKHWEASEQFPVGYRHMCRWFGIKIWEFFRDLNTGLGCKYRYILRIDEDSFIWSPIQYDVFEFMGSNNFSYGFRMCAYEMGYNRFIAPWYSRWSKKTTMTREITRDLCGFYNNFFVADLQFFLSDQVQSYLKAIDRQGFVYRKRYGDLMIHTTAVYAFAPPQTIHRFLDFTYQHVTKHYVINPEQGCVVWGGIQAGYDDADAEVNLDRYMQSNETSRPHTSTFLKPSREG